MQLAHRLSYGFELNIFESVRDTLNIIHGINGDMKCWEKKILTNYEPSLILKSIKEIIGYWCLTLNDFHFYNQLRIYIIHVFIQFHIENPFDT